MNNLDSRAVRLTIAGAALVFVVAGCSSGGDSSKSSSSSAASSATSSAASQTSEAESSTPAASADRSALLMKASDIQAPEPFIMDEPSLNPNGIDGVAALFHTADNTKLIGDTIAVFSDPADASGVLAKAKEALSGSVTGPPEPSPVGTDGTVAAGTSPDGSKAVTVLLFTQGNAFVTLEFDSAEGDLSPAPPEFVEAVGQLQADTLKAAG